MNLKAISEESLQILKQILTDEVCDFNDKHDKLGRFAKKDGSSESKSEKVDNYKNKAELALRRIKMGMPSLDQQVLRATTYAYGYQVVSEEAIKAMSDEKKQKFVDIAMKQFGKMAKAKNDNDVDKAKSPIDKYKSNFDIAQRKVDRELKKSMQRSERIWKQRLSDPTWLRKEATKYYAGKESGSFTGD